jgi:hypothetical protein
MLTQKKSYNLNYHALRASLVKQGVPLPGTMGGKANV